MALTLTEANKLSNDMLLSGLIETIIKESPMMALTPFIEVIGTAITYNRESAMPSVAFRAIGDTWTEDAPTFAQITVALKILGGDADVDNFLATSRADVNDLPAITLAQKVKALAHAWEYTSVYGNASSDALTYDGLHTIITALATTQRLHMGSGSTGAALTLTKLDELIDAVKPGKPDCLMMTRRTRRGLSKYARALTSPIAYQPNEFGQQQLVYDGIPIIINDHQLDTETISSAEYALPTTGATSSIFALKFGEDGVVGFNAGPIPTVEAFDKLETKDATRNRVKAYTALGVKSSVSVARLDGISSADVTA